MFKSIVCSVCGVEFQRNQSEINRNEKLGRKTYCSLSCNGKVNNRHLKGKPENLKANNRRDNHSPFRWHLNNARRHSKDKNREVTVTLEELKMLWEKQEGKCPYTGWELKNMPATNPCYQLAKLPDRASLDRIDSSKGYTADNVQFVSMQAQYAKSIWGEAELKNFCEAVVKNQKD